MYIFIIRALMGILGGLIARSRGRSPMVWFFVCAFFGWFGLLVLLLMPMKEKKEEVVLEENENAEPEKETPKEEEVSSMVPDNWFYLDQEKAVCGPFFLQDLQKKWKENLIALDSWVWNETLVDWKQISQVPSLLQWLQTTTESPKEKAS